MSQPADETRLGELLVTTGKLSSEELLAALEAQRQQGGPQHKQLSEILVDQGHVTVQDLQTTLNVPSSSPVAHESWPSMPASGGSSENLSDEIRQALADPSRCIGRYAKVEELGRGGMGVVHRCYDPQLHRSVAIKMILEAGEANDVGLARFKREARAVAKLQHPGIVALHEVGEHQGSPYLVMDFVEGRSFEALLESENPTARRIVEIVQEIALALHHAHDAGIVHRDVKPQNVIVDRHGKPHVMDFGLARDTSARQQLTKTGQLLGTPVYMAPEQISGDDIGPSTDIYALGAMLYRALVGQPPFLASAPAALFRQILLDEPKLLRRLDPTISADLETITIKCLEKEPDRRYPSAAAVAEELQRFLDGQAIMARPLSQSERAVRWTRRNRALSAALAVVVMVVVGATMVVLKQAATAKQEKQQIQLEAVRREERARLNAERKASIREEAALAEAARVREAEALATLHTEVTAVLDRVRSGEILADHTDARIERTKLLKHQDPETVRLLTAELDALGKLLAYSHELSHGQERFLHFLCRTLADLSLQEGAVASIGGYLKTEMRLPAKHRDPLRAVPAGEALCLLGGAEADRLLRAASHGFGINSSFWSKIMPLYNRTGVEPDLEAKTARGYHDRGAARQDKGDIDGAVADYTRAIEIDPNYTAAWNNRGSLRLDKDDLDGAIADYTRAIELHPKRVRSWNNRGQARKAKDDLSGAIADYTRALELNPQFAATWENRGIARFAKGDLDGAIADYSRAIELCPNDASAWINRGIARRAKGNLDGAIADYTRAIEIDPSFAEAWNNRGNARKEKGDRDGAITDYSRAIKIDPNNALAWNNRGNARQAKGEIDGAIEDHTRALDLNPSYAKASCNRGNARAKKGDMDGAIADWQRFVELAPHHRVAPAIRAKLQKARAQQAKAGAGAGK